MKLASAFKVLCMPSKVYFVLAVIGILLSLLAPSIFGNVSALMHMIHLVYIVFWTWVLHLICKAGYNWLSWVLVLFPFVVITLLAVLTLADASQNVASSPVIILSK